MGRTGALRDGRVGRGSPGSAAARRLMDDARRDTAAQATLAARESYGKLLAILAARTRDVAAAEDALADAFAAALAQWPRAACHPTRSAGF